MKARLETVASRWAGSPRARGRVAVVLAGLFAATAALAVLRPPRAGLTGSYYLNVRWAGKPNLTTRERRVGLDRFRKEYPDGPANVSILWTGGLFVEAPGLHTFAIVSGRGSSLVLDGRTVVDGEGGLGVGERAGAIELSAGFHAIEVRCLPRAAEGVFEAYWTPPGGARRNLSSAPLFTRAGRGAAAVAALRLKRAVLPALLAVWMVLLVGFLALPDRLVSTLVPRLRWHPLTLKLAAFLLANGLVLNVWLALDAERTVLDLARFTLTNPVHDGEDSWRQIANALDYLEAPHERTLYAEVFFAQRHKFQYPPTSLLLLEPLRRLPYPRMVAAANLVSWGALLAGAYVLALLVGRALARSDPSAPLPSPGERAFRVLLALGFTLTFYPVVKAFELGQIQVWLYALFVVALWAWTAGHKVLAGALVGVICAIKPQLGLLVVWAAFRREWRFVAGAAATAGTLGLASLGVFGWATHADYLRTLSYMAKHGESFFTNQSVNGLLNRLAFNGTNLHGSPRAFAPYVPWIYFATLASSLVLVAAALFRRRRRAGGAGTADLLAAALTFTLASPIAWEHHYGVLLPMFALALPALRAAVRSGTWTWTLGLTYVLTSNLFTAANALANTRWNFAQSYLFIGALAFLAVLERWRRAEERKPGEGAVVPAPGRGNRVRT